MKNPKPKEWFNLSVIFLGGGAIHPQLDNIRLINRLILGVPLTQTSTSPHQLMEVAYIQLPGSQQITSNKSIFNPEIFRSVDIFRYLKISLALFAKSPGPLAHIFPVKPSNSGSPTAAWLKSHRPQSSPPRWPWEQ